jgi:hypothetical protein
MYREIETAIKSLAREAGTSLQSADLAMKLSQAALNLAHAAVTIQCVDEWKRTSGDSTGIRSAGPTS